MTVPSNQTGPADWLRRQSQEYQRKLAAWRQASPVLGYDDNHVRRDAHGALIVWGEYGKTTQYGWEIDHELPKVHFPGAANLTGNLRALHWRNNRAKADKLDLSTIARLLRGTQS